MPRPEFNLETPTGSDEPTAPEAKEGTSAASAAPAKSSRPTFELEEPTAGDDNPNNGSAADLLLSLANGLSFNHAKVGARLGDWLADEVGYDRLDGTRIEGDDIIDSIPDSTYTRGAKLVGNTVMAVPASYFAGPTIAGQALAGGVAGGLAAHGAGENILEGQQAGAVTGAVGGVLGKGVQSAGGKIAQFLRDKVPIPKAVPKPPSWLEPTAASADWDRSFPFTPRPFWNDTAESLAQAGAEASENAVRSYATRAGGRAAGSALGDAATRAGVGGVGGALSGGVLAELTGGDWKKGAAMGGLGLGLGGAAKGALTPQLLAKAAPWVDDFASSFARGGVNTVAQMAAPAAGAQSFKVQPNDAAMGWSVESVLSSGATGLLPADEAKLTAAVSEGDADRIKSLNFQMQMKSPEYAKRIQQSLNAVQRGE